MIVFDLDPDTCEYGFRLDGPYVPAAGFTASTRADPARPHGPCGQRPRQLGGTARFIAPMPLPRPHHPMQDFDWEGDRPLELPMQDLIIYETHVRGFTRSLTSAVNFLAPLPACENIPYLKSLGVCFELMPVFEFDLSWSTRARTP